jgi:hypothetical protein
MSEPGICEKGAATMRRFMLGLLIVAPMLTFGATPSSAFGWYGYGYRAGYYCPPRVYGYSYRPYYRSYYRPAFVYGGFYRPRVWGWRSWGWRGWGWGGRGWRRW